MDRWVDVWVNKLMGSGKIISLSQFSCKHDFVREKKKTFRHYIFILAYNKHLLAKTFISLCTLLKGHINIPIIYFISCKTKRKKIT